jgi:hypothetical protein
MTRWQASRAPHPTHAVHRAHAARTQAEAMRLQTEDYVDAKLANFEVVLHKTLSAVERGREKLRGRLGRAARGRAVAGPALNARALRLAGSR